MARRRVAASNRRDGTIIFKCTAHRATVVARTIMWRMRLCAMRERGPWHEWSTRRVGSIPYRYTLTARPPRAGNSNTSFL